MKKRNAEGADIANDSELEAKSPRQLAAVEELQLLDDAESAVWADAFVANTELLTAAQKNNLSAVESFLRQGAALVVQDKKGRTALHVAAKHGYTEIALAIARAFPSAVNASDMEGLTPMHIAARKGHLAIVEGFIAVAPDARHICWKKYNASPLYLAAANGRTTIVKWWAEHFPEDMDRVNNRYLTPLHSAAYWGNVATVEYIATAFPKLLNTTCYHSDAGAPPSGPVERRTWEQRNKTWTPLLLAAAQGRIGVVQYLAEHFPETMKAKDALGRTPLHLAVEYGHIATSRYIAKKCPGQIAMQTKPGYYDMATPVHLAIHKHHQTIARHLIEALPDIAIHLRDGDNWTPLDLLAKYSEERIVLLQHVLACGAYPLDVINNTVYHALNLAKLERSPLALAPLWEHCTA